jgi:hypothetical protein
MTIDTTRIAMARQMAGHIPDDAEVIGLVTESDDCYCRNWSALVRMATGVYVTMIDHTIRSLDPAIARAAIARATV